MGWFVIVVNRVAFHKDFPNNGLFIKADICSANEWKLIFKNFRHSRGELNSLVNNAAIQI
jgi:NAD(P)-dependent dehydrogenase (short-subunit alcohol dehydrogenase family)